MPPVPPPPAAHGTSPGHAPSDGTPPGHTPAEDAQLAASLAERAGHLLLQVRRGARTGRALGDEGDRRAHILITAELARARPGDAVLSEEGADDPARLSARRVWIVDPLDGTREFREPGRKDWAVHIALVEDDELVAGAVALPAQGLVLSSNAPPPLGPLATAPRLVASRSRAPEIVHHVAADLGAEVVPLGSAGAKIAAVVLGHAEIYVHAGGQYEWDSAAPVAVATAAGLHCSRLDGSPLRYNQPDPYLPDLVVCRPELAAAVLASIGSATL